MIGQHPLPRKSWRVFYLLAVFAGWSALPAGGQPIFSARDFLQTLQFNPGHDISVDSNGVPMAVSAGGIYLGGTFQTAGEAFQGYLRKYDSGGKEVWTRQIAAADTPFLSALAVDATGVYLAGSVGLGHVEMFVRKYDQSGNELWSRQVRISDGYHLGAGLAADSSGLYVAAWDGRDQGLVRKYSPTGDELWSRALTVRSFRGLSLNGDVYVTGVNSTGGFVSRFTAGGDAVWTRQLDAEPTETVVPAAAGADSTGIYLAGSIYQRVRPDDITFIPATGQSFLRKLDPSGTEAWTRRFGAPDSVGIVSVALDQAGIYVAGATTHALPAQCKAGSADVFIRKFDSAGAEQWTRQFGTSGYDFPGNLALDGSGLYLSGGIRGGAAHGSAFVAKLGKTQAVPAGTQPEVWWECVLNAASYAGGGVAPGEIVTIFGRNMGPTDTASFRLADDGRIATSLADARVLFNGVAAPLLFVSAAQSGAIVPSSAAPGSTVTVEVEYRGVRSSVLTLPVAPARPGIFTMDGSGIGQGAVLNEDGSINSPANPAARGSIISIYVTGSGLTDPAAADGSILGSQAPPSSQPIGVFFDDPSEVGSISPAEVPFGGGAPQSVAGLIQVNVRIPSWVRPGGAAAIYLQAGSEYAEPGVTVAVR